MRRRRAGAAVCAALAAALLTGCGQQHGGGGTVARGDEAGGAGGTGAAPPPVLDHVPTHGDRVVFLTYDDGAERAPGFTDLVRDRRLPVTLFLADTVAGPAYGHFARLRAVGASLQNHTLDHTVLRGLPHAGQHAEICGQQRKLNSRFGVRPRLLRPPHGRYDAATLRAAADCGITAVVLWRAAPDATGSLAFTRGEPRLRPGDIIAVDPDHPAPHSLTQRTEHLLRQIEAAGLRVAALEEYL
ncbi:polysaccharide deacetylase family protein [Streptomyces sp. CRN 30]|uniref:polysaccharide deacetylase family protein n=1 Tax=Streptomyces sp. CRN 30 TaxID=3075613 RepID=UPI002A8217A0|nr:polysaccharide deacetylase family protein [Streptomyces sp. CRN 30]